MMIPLFDYDKHRLIMESSFKFEGYDFLYFDEGVPFYTLYRGNWKLSSFLQIKYVAEVLYYLNREIDHEVFYKLILDLSDRGNGHSIRTYDEDRVLEMCNEVLASDKEPYVRQYRRIIFNPSRNIKLSEKQAIVGQIMGSFRKGKCVIDEKDVYEQVEQHMEKGTRITYKNIAENLNVSRQTVSKKVSPALKEVIKYHNRH